jgi:peptidoglycan L-alanyl-D-glutamate endopeptidase CwlK
MSDLPSKIKSIQRHVGAEPDGVFGPMTAELVLRELSRDVSQERDEVDPDDQDDDANAPLSPRTLRNIATLDERARPLFLRFAMLANATAATYGCEYVMIAGNRTWEEQDALYAKGRSAPGPQVTKAKGGFSNHNFAIAGDFGVFRSGDYLENGTPEAQSLAARVHRACSIHAKACGLEWGGNWRTFPDYPHYEVELALSMSAKRKLFREKGSVL